jgi:hypothetical protein
MGKLLDKLIGDSEDRAFKKQVDAEAKIEEKKAWRTQYQISRLKAAKEKGKKRAVKSVKKNTEGGGILDTLGKLGEYGNAATKGIVGNLDINPDGLDETFSSKRKNKNNPFDLGY